MNASVLRRLWAEPGYQPYLVVEVNYEQDVPNPNDDGDWKLVSFNSRHVNFEHPDNYFEGGKPRRGLANKLRAGTAFLLSYFEHGQCQWSLQGTGPQCNWDTVQLAGLLLWTQPVKNLGPRTYESRSKNAESYLQRYTAWCNGEVYQYMVRDDEESNSGEGCGGFFDAESLVDSIATDVDGMDVVFRGQLAEMVSGSADFNEVEPEEEDD